MTTTCILHGGRWPNDAACAVLRDRVRAAIPDVEILEVRGSATAPEAAAPAINEAAARAAGDRLVVVEPWTTLDLRALLAAAEAAPDALVVEADADGRALSWPGPAAELDLVGALALSITEPSQGGDAADAAGGRPPIRAFAIARARFLAAGGLAPLPGAIGLVEDLAVRLMPDVPVVAGPVSSTTASAAWPLPVLVARALAWRNRIVTALGNLPPDWLGLELARTAVEALRASTDASGFTGERFRFGGDWGVGEGSLARLLRPGAHGAGAIIDPLRTLLPLLALDSALDEVPALVAARRGRPPRVVLPAPGEGRRTTTPLDPLGTARLSPAPRVSVIVVTWNGREHLRDCFESLLCSDYPLDRLEIICVDNGSTDDTGSYMRDAFPQVRLVTLPGNEGFTGGTVAGVAASAGEVLVFFNNDMRVEPSAVRHLVAGLDDETACAAARVLSWDGAAIDFVRGTINFEGRGFQDFYGDPAASPRARSAETFFPNGGAFAVTRAAYDRAGGFDQAFFAYYDDVDLGWRLRVTGTAIRVVDAAVVYHRHGATSRTQPQGQKQFLMERNALWTILKTYAEPTLHRTLGACLLLAVRRIVDDVRIQPRSAALAGWASWSRRVPADAGTENVSPIAGLPAESLAAIGAALDALPEVARARARVQAARRVDDPRILPHLGRTFERLSSFSSYAPVHDGLVEALALSPLFRPRTRLLIVSHEAIATNMSGPAVRFLEIGRALSDVARVTIAMPGTPVLRDARCTLAGYDPARPDALARLAEEADVLFVQGFALTQFPFLTGMAVPIIVDLYCPFTVEHLEQARGRHAPDDGRLLAESASILAVQNAQLDAGDFFLCASEAQRDFWIGNLHARGRINPRTYAADPTLRRLIDVVPFGLPDQPFDEAARSLPPVLKGVRPGIGPDDVVLLWGGSLLDWQDPLTLIEAVALLVPARPALKLFFMGTRHPNPLVAPMAVVERSRTRAAELGLLDTRVFFNDWVPYAERARYLHEADLGVSTHREHLETHYAFRTRMLDYIWARLPIVCTEGDVFGSLVAARGLGVAVPPGDPAALAAAIDGMLGDPSRRARARAELEALATELTWSRVVAPLTRFVRDPVHAADRAAGVQQMRERLEAGYRFTKWLRRTALRAGISERRIEQLKRLGAVQSLMVLRNRLALARARRTAGRV